MRAPGRLRELLVADRVEQVGLAEADAAADEHRVVLRRVARGGGLRRGERELVRRAGDEGVERVARVERRGLGRDDRVVGRRADAARRASAPEPRADGSRARASRARLGRVDARGAARARAAGGRSGPSGSNSTRTCVVAEVAELLERAGSGSWTRTRAGRSCWERAAEVRPSKEGPRSAAATCRSSAGIPATSGGRRPRPKAAVCHSPAPGLCPVNSCSLRSSDPQAKDSQSRSYPHPLLECSPAATRHELSTGEKRRRW